MKKLLKLVCFLTCLSGLATAQQSSDFYVAFSKSQTNDTVHVYVSVQKHQNISYEVFDVEIKEKGAEGGEVFQISSRFPYGIVNDLNMYVYHIPYIVKNGVTYQISLNNKRLCLAGPLTIEERFSSENIHTFSYADPGYRLIQPVKLK